MDALISQLRNAKSGPELWERSSGINEFDLVYESGIYYMFFYAGSGITVRQADSIAGLYYATETSIISATLRYPTAQLSGGFWHIMAYDAGGGITKYYKSANSSVTSAYTVQTDPFPSSLYDSHLRFNPTDSKWVCALKGSKSDPLPDAVVNIWTADAIGGPWTDKGQVFSQYQRKPWAYFEEADPAPFFINGNNYLLFASYDGIRQKCSIVQLDSNYKATGDPIVLVNPTEPWEINSMAKVNNPVFLVEPNGKQRVYFTQNYAFGSPVGAFGGWGYIEVRDSNLWSGRPDTLIFGTNFKNRCDDYSGNSLNLYGNYNINDNGISFSTASGGAQGFTGFTWLENFTLRATLTPGVAADNQTIVIFGDQAMTNYFGLFLDVNNNLQYSWGPSGTRNNVGFLLETKSTIIIRKIFDRMEFWINGKIQSVFYHGQKIRGETYRIGNKFFTAFGGDVTAVDDQFAGTIHSIDLFNEILRQDFFNI